jgi:hypothetical protein
MSAAQDWFAASTRATELQRAAVARLIGIACAYSLAPFAAMQTGDGWRLAACLSPPPHLDPDGMLQWQPDGDVALIDPATGAATLAGDDGGHILGDVDPMRGDVRLFANGLGFARAWAATRAAWLELHRRGNIPGLALTEPADHGLPGMLLAGPIGKLVDLSPIRHRKRILIDDPMTARQIGQAMLAAAHLPQIDATASQMKVAA